MAASTAPPRVGSALADGIISRPGASRRRKMPSAKAGPTRSVVVLHLLLLSPEAREQRSLVQLDGIRRDRVVPFHLAAQAGAISQADRQQPAAVPDRIDLPVLIE